MIAPDGACINPVTMPSVPTRLMLVATTGEAIIMLLVFETMVPRLLILPLFPGVKCITSLDKMVADGAFEIEP